MSREDELIRAIKDELEQLRGDRVKNCRDGVCPRLDSELNAINMAEAAVDRAVRKFPPKAPGTGIVITMDPVRSGIATGGDFHAGYAAGMRQASKRMETRRDRSHGPREATPPGLI
jgi:hypothetical protein